MIFQTAGCCIPLSFPILDLIAYRWKRKGLIDQETCDMIARFRNDLNIFISHVTHLSFSQIESYFSNKFLHLTDRTCFDHGIRNFAKCIFHSIKKFFSTVQFSGKVIAKTISSILVTLSKFLRNLTLYVSKCELQHQN